MAVREFTDSKNVVWRVWDVTTAQMHPVTKNEDFMGDLADGWLAFESADEKRRLAAPYPAEWATRRVGTKRGSKIQGKQVARPQDRQPLATPRQRSTNPAS